MLSAARGAAQALALVQAQVEVGAGDAQVPTFCSTTASGSSGLGLGWHRRGCCRCRCRCCFCTQNTKTSHGVPPTSNGATSNTTLPQRARQLYFDTQLAPSHIIMGMPRDYCPDLPVRPRQGAHQVDTACQLSVKLISTTRASRRRPWMHGGMGRLPAALLCWGSPPNPFRSSRCRGAAASPVEPICPSVL